MRWEELSWDKVRRAQMRWSVGCEECSVKCEVWSVKEAVRSEKCEVWTVKCEECSVKGGVWSVQCGVWRLQWEVRSAKWSFKCDMWNKTPLSQSARTHGLGWRTAHASSIDEKGLIYIFKATSAPPRAGTTGIYIYNMYIYVYIYICMYVCVCVYDSMHACMDAHILPHAWCMHACMCTCRRKHCYMLISVYQQLKTLYTWRERERERVEQMDRFCTKTWMTTLNHK